MPTNFRLAYNSDGLNYIDLFPRTTTGAIIGADNIYEITQLQVDIPAPSTSTLTQSVAISTTPQMVSAPFRMYLVSTGEQAESDYSTITQVQVQENELIVTRLYNMPTDTITVGLVFFEQRGAI